MKTKRFTAILAIFSLFLLGGTATMAGGDHGKATAHAVVSTFEVNGMTCGGCSSGLRLQVKKLEGVEDVKVSHEENFASVTYDPEKVSTKDILKAIEKMGFKGKLQKTEEKGA
jgi:copper chaperone CopZ